MPLPKEVYEALIKSEEVRGKKNLYLQIIKDVAKATDTDILGAIDQIITIEVAGKPYSPVMIESLRRTFFDKFEVPVRLCLKNDAFLIAKPGNTEFVKEKRNNKTTTVNFIFAFKGGKV